MLSSDPKIQSPFRGQGYKQVSKWLKGMEKPLPDKDPYLSKVGFLRLVLKRREDPDSPYHWMSDREIARRLGVRPWQISREYKRGTAARPPRYAHTRMDRAARLAERATDPRSPFFKKTPRQVYNRLVLLGRKRGWRQARPASAE